MISILPIANIAEVQPGDDLAAVLADAMRESGIEPAPFDILVVTQKIVSKAEDRFVDLRTVTPGEEALALAAVTSKDPRLVQLVLAESASVVRAAPHVLITRHHTGHVMANAGIDRSNLGPGRDEMALLLPEDADASADRLRADLESRHGMKVAVLISDSFGRPWRHGVVGVAIGASGMPALIDRRGELDRDGRELQVTQVALGDLLATAAVLATGEGAEGIAAALIRGVTWQAPDVPAAGLVRPVEQDLFR